MRATAAQKETIRSAAVELGFVACGFTDCAPLGCGSLLDAWIAERRHGFMDYLARDPAARIDPTKTAPTARSVVVAAWPYQPSPVPCADWRLSLTGRIASYARGQDYHVSLTDRLSRLASLVERTCGGATRTHVDAGPLVEKELARRAGLGWYGRNTNLLSREHGSYLLLACLLTEAEIEADRPFEGHHCGDCTACVPACPTGALDRGPTIDAPRCISYLTIEHRGPIPIELRPALDNWVFGCDVCQEVCPWNAPASDPDPFLSPSLVELLFIDADSFHTAYAGSAVARAKPRTLARNAAIALGNSGNPEAVPVLAEALMTHREPLVRSHAAWALGRVGGSQAARALRRAVEQRSPPPVGREVASALAAVERAEIPSS